MRALPVFFETFRIALSFVIKSIKIPGEMRSHLKTATKAGDKLPKVSPSKKIFEKLLMKI